MLVSRARLGSLYETNSGLRLLAKIEQANREDKDAGKRKNLVYSFSLLSGKGRGDWWGRGKDIARMPTKFVCSENESEYENESGEEKKLSLCLQMSL